MRKNIVFFDIDGVLNGYCDVITRAEFKEKIQKEKDEEAKQALISKKKEILPTCYLSLYGNEIGFVSKEKLIKFKNIIDKYDVEVIGISSWFVLDFEKNKEDFEKFFGFKIKEVGGFGTADQRSQFALDFLNKNHEPNEINVVYIDDMNDFENHKTISKLSNLNTLFIFPEGAYGMQDNHFKMMEKWFK